MECHLLGELAILPATCLPIPRRLAVDCEISADTSESGGLAPSITGIPAHEQEEPTEALMA